MEFKIYRYDPDTKKPPYMQSFEVKTWAGMMLRDALLEIQKIDESFVFRHSCGEGVCGSDALNVNGKNQLACITAVDDLKQPIEVRPLPARPVIRDLIVDMKQFYQQYQKVKPWMIHHDPLPEHEILQSPAEREKLDGLYECILCGCCSTSCPSFWWNPDKFYGPQALLQAWRFLADSRDQADQARLADLDDTYKLFRCHTIMNCVDACPKDLNPTKAISLIKKLMLKNQV